MTTSGVLYITWGGGEGLLKRSTDSVKRHHPDLPIHVERLPNGSTLLDKARMVDLTPFDETLFLDADTVVLGDLSLGFDMATRHGLACCVCECPWAQRYNGWQGEGVEYNTGVLFWTKDAKPLMRRWQEVATMIDSSMTWTHDGGKQTTMPINDQAGFAYAVRQTGFNPFVLPMNYNLRPKWHRQWFGPVKVWHDYGHVPPYLAGGADAIPPMTFCELGA